MNIIKWSCPEHGDEHLVYIPMTGPLPKKTAVACTKCLHDQDGDPYEDFPADNKVLNIIKDIEDGDCS